MTMHALYSSDLGRIFIHGAYLVAAALFVIGLRRLSQVRRARHGNRLAALGMGIAVLATVLSSATIGWLWVLSGVVVGSLIGTLLAQRVKMTAMPELVAFFNGMGGGASAAVAISFFYATANGPSSFLTLVVMVLSVAIGTLTLTGSIVAFGKLSGRLSGNSVLVPGRHAINVLLILATIGAAIFCGAVANSPASIRASFLTVAGLSGLLGILLVIPIGGADMPVVISLLNSYSGIAASMAGFVLLGRSEPSAFLLIISGALVGASGLILTNIMCRAMNRSLLNVLLGGFGTKSESATPAKSDYEGVKSFTAEEAAMILDSAESVIIVPGYGLAVAQAQHALAELDLLLESRGATVRYAIHPVAGRMPGHMNVLLAEANVLYEKLFELDEINGDFSNTQVAIVVGANDVTNPAALSDTSSPIFGMPILTCYDAQHVIVIKRSLSPGYAGIKNSLFERDNTMMLFADAKQALSEMAKEIKAL